MNVEAVFDLRERVVQGILDSLTYTQIAERFAVSVSFVSKLLSQWRETGTVEPAKFGGHKTSTLAPHEATVRNLLAAEPYLPRVCGSWVHFRGFGAAGCVFSRGCVAAGAVSALEHVGTRIGRISLIVNR